MSEFLEFPKMARLTRECIITEKIDGTNAQVYICRIDDYLKATQALASNGDLYMFAGSRTRWITPDNDNFGFAAWVKEHADELWALGEGRHFGEWWGAGIQRRYGLDHKRFSLFNTSRWVEQTQWTSHGLRGPLGDGQEYAPECCHVVPVLYRGLFGPKHADNYIEKLKAEGSMAAPGFMQPEGVVVYHVAAGVGFKKTIEKDDQPKSRHAAA
jgi:hypothetical protein